LNICSEQNKFAFYNDTSKNGKIIFVNEVKKNVGLTSG